MALILPFLTASPIWDPEREDAREGGEPHDEDEEGVWIAQQGPVAAEGSPSAGRTPGPIDGLGLSFEENSGQLADPSVRFIYQSGVLIYNFHEGGYSLRLSGEGTVSMIEVVFSGGAAGTVAPLGTRPLASATSYLIGNDQDRWFQAARFECLEYRDLYPGIDLVFHPHGHGLKYDLLIAPGADPGQVRLAYHGVEGLHVDTSGDLHLDTNWGELVEQAPVAYQELEGRRLEVASRYRLEGATLGYEVGAYDPSRPLVIDPLIFSTFLGGESGGSYGQAVAVDDEGHVYVCAASRVADYPVTPGSHDLVHNGDYDIAVTKLEPDGRSLVYSTFIGGSGTDTCTDLVLDAAGRVHLVGTTSSEDFPLTDNALMRTLQEGGDSVIVTVSADGSDLEYSSYFGGNGIDRLSGVAVDTDGNLYGAGYTRSEDLPTTDNAYQPEKSEHDDCFVFQLMASGTELFYMSYLGGDYVDACSDLALDGERNPYLTGYTLSDDYPTTPGAWDNQRNGVDAVISKFDLSEEGSDSLAYSTFVGGSDWEQGAAITVDDQGRALITGLTWSSDYPVTPNAYQRSLMGRGDLMVFKIDALGAMMVASTYLGGNGYETGTGIALDSQDNVYLTGNSGSSDFNTTFDAYDETGEQGCIVSRFIDDLSNLRYSSYFNGEMRDDGYGIAVDPNDDETVYVVGQTYSSWFPVSPTAFDIHRGGVRGGIGAFLLKVNPSKEFPKAIIDSIDPQTAQQNETVTFDGHAKPGSTVLRYVWHSSLDGELYNGSISHYETDQLTEGWHRIWFKVQDATGVWSEADCGALRVDQRPIAIIRSMAPSPVLFDEKVRFVSDGYDPDGEIWQRMWYSDIDGLLGGSLSEELNFTTRYLSLGTHVITHKVCDEEGVWSEPVTAMLVVTLRPEATIDTFAPDPVLEGRPLRLVARGTDDGAIVTYRWNSDIDGVFYSGPLDNLTVANLSSGRHTLQLRVRDDNGIWSPEVDCVLTVTTRPVAAIVDLDPESALRERPVTLTGSGTDDGSLRRYAWRSSLDGELYNGSLATIDYDGLSGGTHTLYLAVQDNHGFWSREVSTELVVIERPWATIISISPGAVAVGEEVLFQGQGSGPFPIVRYAWRSSLDGEFHNGSQDRFQYDGLSAGTHAIHLMVQDQRGGWSREVMAYLTVSGRPTAFIDLVWPSPAIAGESVTLSGHGSQGEATARYQWRSSLDGELYLGSLAEVVLPGLSPGQHTLYLTVKGNGGSWSQEAETTLSVIQRPVTVIDSVSADRQAGRLLVSLQGHASPTERIVRYVWYSSLDGEIHNGSRADVVTGDLREGNHILYLTAQDESGVWSRETACTISLVDPGGEDEDDLAGLPAWLLGLSLILVTTLGTGLCLQYRFRRLEREAREPAAAATEGFPTSSLASASAPANTPGPVSSGSSGCGTLPQQDPGPDPMEVEDWT